MAIVVRVSAEANETDDLGGTAAIVDVVEEGFKGAGVPSARLGGWALVAFDLCPIKIAKFGPFGRSRMKTRLPFGCRARRA